MLIVGFYRLLLIAAVLQMPDDRRDDWVVIIFMPAAFYIYIRDILRERDPCKPVIHPDARVISEEHSGILFHMYDPRLHILYTDSFDSVSGIIVKDVLIDLPEQCIIEHRHHRVCLKIFSSYTSSLRNGMAVLDIQTSFCLHYTDTRKLIRRDNEPMYKVQVGIPFLLQMAESGIIDIFNADLRV